MPLSSFSLPTLDSLIRGTLTHLQVDKDVDNASNLILGTILVESNGFELVQNKGPALSMIQMEPRTHDDIWDNYIDYRKDLREKLIKAAQILGKVSAAAMVWNLKYAICMCRIHYLRVPEPLQPTPEGQAKYWKTFYNTNLGKGSEEKYMIAWKRWKELND